MPTHRPVCRVHLAIVMSALIVATPVPAFAGERAFTGIFAGADVGRQSVVGGSLVSGVDVLSQDSRTVFSIVAGVCYQFEQGLVVGFEGSVGFLDGDLRLSDPSHQLEVGYRNDSQTTVGLNAGYALGPDRRWLLFGYISEATRKFDVTVEQAMTIFGQNDEQGMLRFGAGVERQVFRHLHLRMNVGTQRADFGGQQTNIEVKKTLEFGAAVRFFSG